MIRAIKDVDHIEVDGATDRIIQIAPNANKEAIRNVLSDIEKAKDRKKHIVYKTLIDK